MTVEVFQGPPRTSLEEVAGRLRGPLQRIGAHRAYVFGSYATGTADRYSDLDLLIVAPTELGPFERARLLPEAWELGVAVDVLFYTPSEWDELVARGSPLATRILDEGRLIHERPES